MTIDDKIKDKELQYNIKREAAKYQHYHFEKLINMSIIPSNRRQIIEQAKFTYSALGKALEKQTEKH